MTLEDGEEAAAQLWRAGVGGGSATLEGGEEAAARLWSSGRWRGGSQPKRCAV